MRADSCDERTATKVAPARTRVPPAVARAEIVAQSAIVRYYEPPGGVPTSSDACRSAFRARRHSVVAVRMSDTEAIMWAVEKDPALRSDFCNLTILDGVPDDERMRRTMARAVAAIPRLGQRVVGAPLRIVPPAFADDPALDLSAHVRR